MATRGRKPGWSKAAQESQESAAPLPAHARENPVMLEGDALRALAHRRGLAKSDMAKMDDEKIREQLRYLTHRQYSDALV